MSNSIPAIRRPFENPYFFGHTKQWQQVATQFAKRGLVQPLLLEGIKGVGKATFAFHVAWNVLKKDDTTRFLMPHAEDLVWHQIQKQSCGNCLYITRQNGQTASPSIISVDLIRNINTFLQQTPAQGSFRVVIIDSTDELNANSSNALLKILEEPPEKVFFMLVSHKPGKVLSTIRSRCQFLHFRPLDENFLWSAVQAAFKDSLPVVEPQQLKKILYRAEGSVGRACFWLDRGRTQLFFLLHHILEEAALKFKEVEKLATLFSNKEEQPLLLDYYVGEILWHIAQKSKRLLAQGAVNESWSLAIFWSRMQQYYIESQKYNLDRKQFILMSCVEAHKKLHKT